MTPPPTVTSEFSSDDRQRLSKLIDYSQLQSVPEIWTTINQQPSLAARVALHDPHGQPVITLTYRQLCRQIQQFAAGMQALGVAAGDRIALFSDNSPTWLVADQGLMLAGAVDVVRSSQADRDELLYILSDSGSTGMVVENEATLAKLRDRLQDLPIQFVVLLSQETPGYPDQQTPLKLLNFDQVMQMGANQTLQPVSLQPQNLATLLYTSGTTGKPKGVMLTHGNLLHQINTLGVVVQPTPGDRVLSLLPTWHAYERTIEYFLLSQGCSQTYTSLRHVKQDLKKVQPHFMVGVPRLWESIYEGVQKQLREQPASRQKLVSNLLANSQHYVMARNRYLGLDLDNLTPSLLERLGAGLEALGRWPVHRLAQKMVYLKIRAATGGHIKQVISGGGSLAGHLDTFYNVIGVSLLVGYGLTETAPVLTARRPWRNILRSAGQPLPGTEIRIVDPESRQPLPVGQRGLVLGRGPQIMQGYYLKPDATAKAIDADGWFDTGDLGLLSAKNDLVLTGRAKDTIVLTNGENIEPQPIEDACLRSPYIDQMMLVGQDQKSLGALIVPNLEALGQWAANQHLRLTYPGQDPSASDVADGVAAIEIESQLVQDLFRQELNREVKNRPGYRPDDRIGPFQLILEPFSIENGMMTQTLKIRRPVVTERYRGMIDGMFI